MKKFLCLVVLCLMALTVPFEVLAWSGEASEFPGVMVAAVRTRKKIPAKKTQAKKQCRQKHLQNLNPNHRSKNIMHW